jgi:hypothetical protein
VSLPTLMTLLHNGPRDFDFSLAMGADYSLYVKSIVAYAPLHIFSKHVSLIRQLGTCFLD